MNLRQQKGVCLGKNTIARIMLLLVLAPLFLAACKTGLGESITPKRLDANPTGKLNDTGITLCGDFAPAARSNNDVSPLLTLDADNDPIPPANRVRPDGSIDGQDCHRGRDVTHNDNSDGHAGFSFTKMNAAGEKTDDPAATVTCVRDEVTGLVWQVSGSPTPMAWDATGAYIAEASKEGLCGYGSGWRLPTPVELSSIAKLEGTPPTIDTSYFPGTAAAGYWTSAEAVDGGAWAVSFATGTEVIADKASAQHVRVVVGGAAPIPPPPPPGETTYTAEVTPGTTVTEGEPAVTVRIVRSGGMANAETLAVSAVAGTATAGADYTFTPSTIRFAANSPTSPDTATLTVVDDRIVDGVDETLTVIATKADGTTVATIPISIRDNDTDTPTPAPFHITVSPSPIIEGNTGTKPVSVTISRSSREGSLPAAMLTLRTGADGDSATPGKDYVSVSKPIPFAAGEPSKSEVISINGDVDVESPTGEIFTITISNSDPATGAISGTGVVKVTIEEDDRPPETYTIEPRTPTVPERGILSLTIKRAGGDPAAMPAKSIDITNAPPADLVRASVVGSDASDVADYSFSRAVSFLAGSDTAKVDIAIKEDDIDEDNEVFYVSLPGAKSSDPSSYATITITDDDEVKYTLTPISDQKLREGSEGAFATEFKVKVTRTPSSKSSYVNMKITSLSNNDGKLEPDIQDFATDDPEESSYIYIYIRDLFTSEQVTEKIDLGGTIKLTFSDKEKNREKDITIPVRQDKGEYGDGEDTAYLDLKEEIFRVELDSTPKPPPLDFTIIDDDEVAD